MATKRPLFPQLNGVLHGGDYNPDQWLDRPDILQKDIELMKKAGINSATLGVFSWATYEPNEGEFNFDWLEEIMDSLYENGIYTILATPSGARPAWLDFKYPEAMRVAANGHRNRHGIRHNHCMTSQAYRDKVEIIDSKLAERFANHKGLLMWHISNEFGGDCYCESCQEKFREFLKERYENDINKLNKAWWNSFWSHTYNSFDQIEPPFENGETGSMGLTLDWKRFTTQSTTDFMKFEIDVVHRYNPDIPTTTNFMDIYEGLDYHVMCQAIDVTSWDSYPLLHNDFETMEDVMMHNTFNHRLFQSMKKNQPFMLMESCPGVVNWHEVNKYRRPGFHKILELQAVANGSDTVQYFQWRKSRGAYEQFHGAVVDHLGTDDTRVFKEVASLGDDLSRLSEVAGTIPDNKVAILFDWDNRWAIQEAKTLADATKKYVDTCIDFYTAMLRMGQDADIISQDMPFDDYKIILAPMMFLLHDGIGDKIADFIKKGGQVLTTYFTGCVDKSTLCYLGGFPGQGLADVFGVIAEETDTFYPSDRNYIKFAMTGTRREVFDYQEMLRVNGAKTLASFEGDYVAGMSAITENAYGDGYAYYVGCRTKASDLNEVFTSMFDRAGLTVCQTPAGIEHHTRFDEKHQYDFFSNYTDKPIMVRVANSNRRDLLHDQVLPSAFEVPALDVMVVKSDI